MKKRVLQVIGRLGRGGDSVAVFNIMNNMNLEEISFDFVTHEGCDKKLVEELKSKGHNVIVLRGDVRALGPVKYYLEIKKVIKEYGPYDIIHMHTSMQSGIAMMAAKHCKIKTRICHSHTAHIQRKVSKFKEIFYIPVLRMLLNHYSTIKVACGEDAGKYLFKNKEFKVINNGIELEKYLSTDSNTINDIVKSLRLKEGELVLGQVGRFSEMKNHKFTIELMEKLAKMKVKVRCIFVGDGVEKDNIIKMAKEKGVFDFCEFVGHVKNVQDYLHIIDILLLPSLMGEGLPITLIEAQASNCYSIASDFVTKEADLGLGLVKYCSLDSIDDWIESIKKSNNIKHCETKDIYDVLKNKKFDNKDAVAEWLSLYMI
ncbi:MAG: glycosyltransferase [Clostridium sp.]|nr:glycosyltransferase [Clostridium sp.]